MDGKAKISWSTSALTAVIRGLLYRIKVVVQLSFKNMFQCLLILARTVQILLVFDTITLQRESKSWSEGQWFVPLILLFFSDSTSEWDNWQICYSTVSDAFLSLYNKILCVPLSHYVAYEKDVDPYMSTESACYWEFLFTASMLPTTGKPLGACICLDNQSYHISIGLLEEILFLC